MADIIQNIENIHYSEEEIALFALGEEFSEQEKKDFFDHLEKCFSCKNLYEEMSEFYEAADKPELLLKSSEERESNKQDLRAQYKSSFFSSLASYNYYIPAKWVSFVFRRPVLSGGSFLFLIALFVLALNFKALVKDTNPVSYMIDDSKGDVNIYNKDKEFLWKIHFTDNFNERNSFEEVPGGICRTVVCDLNDDGKNEVVTSRHLFKKYQDKSFLSVYDYKGNIIEKKSFEEAVSWKGYKYPAIYFFDQIVLNKNVDGNQFDLFARYNHYHAPGRLLRLNKELNIIGEFWHRGHILEMHIYYNDFLKKKNLFLSGCNDLIHRAVLIVLNPDKLVGKKESGSTLGYGFGTTEAELCTIQFPETDVLKATESRDVTYSVVEYNDFYEVSVGRKYTNPPICQDLLYYFTKDFKLISITMGDGFQNLQNKLFSEGKVKEKWSPAYQKKLMDGVRYWNGKEWQKEWFMLNQK